MHVISSKVLEAIKASIDALERQINKLEADLVNETEEVNRMCRVSLENDYANLAILKDWYSRTITTLE